MKSNIVNPEDIKSLISKDRIFKSIYDKYGSPPNWSRPQNFESLAKLILEQQVSLASAEAHYQKLKAYIGEFTPAKILKLTDEEMRSCYISRQKTTYLRALANAITHNEINLEKLSELDESEARKQLMQIKGIGNWTADIYLMECFQSKDIFPLGDVAAVNTVKKLYNVKTTDEVEVLSKKWKPLRSLAAHFFWHYYLSNRNH